jgi:heat shock protein HslJ
MRTTLLSFRLLAPFLVFIASAQAQTQPSSAGSDLLSRSWQLVKFQGGDGATLAPPDKTMYTITFAADGHVSARIDCNRGSGTWNFAGAGQLEFGPLALTRAMCPPAPLNDRIPKDWPSVRSYTLKDGHLFLTLMANGGAYDFEPVGPEGPPAKALAIERLPATFSGTLPCADCPGILYQLNLFPDHTFVSRMSYQERDTQVDDRGIWELAGDGKTLVLRGRGGEKQKFALRDSQTLRKLDQAGQEIVSKLNYDLKRAPTFAPLEPNGCNAATASLENTYWKLTQLRDSAISASPKNEPHLILDSETRRVSGSGGCNRLVGSYTLDGDRLNLRPYGRHYDGLSGRHGH